MGEPAGIVLTVIAWALIALQVWQTRHDRARIRRVREARAASCARGRVDSRGEPALD
ncbi:hypothetical protein [Nocardioides sp. cx-173]|uniref:hypothetical protein n=1 Tax=Nocardioides sp. cx-173 TaxID=2898796 RepID=UPI001E31C8B5|nr:hypothetical protein [Nocardioides sp. cx-173]MCD4524797.1 hypothetical protein [Nocardioides sp. cx-173]UGB43304.1 hypothetical protein LQ940_07185 [Nocardioides sp. cx-173]